MIDHHRKGVGYIDNSVIFYHEPYASSASELVTELVQYAGGEKEDKMTPLEAQALLAGITLDTRNFALHTGVRTFEAAAYLRRMGAQTQEVKMCIRDSSCTRANIHNRFTGIVSKRSQLFFIPANERLPMIIIWRGYINNPILH